MGFYNFSTLWLIIFIAYLCMEAIFITKKNALKMTATPLTEQYLFKAAIRVPVFSFLYFGFFSWWGHHPDFSPSGFSNFIETGKLPLGLLSLTIPFVAVINNIHRTIQTNTQILSSESKNKSDAFYSHQKNCIEFFTNQINHKYNLYLFKNKTPTSVERKLTIKYPFRLYKSFYPTLSIENFDLTPSIKQTNKIMNAWNRFEQLFSILNAMQNKNILLRRRLKTLNAIEQHFLYLDKILQLSGISHDFIGSVQNNQYTFKTGIINKKELINKLETYLSITNDIFIFVGVNKISNEKIKNIILFFSSEDHYLDAGLRAASNEILDIMNYLPCYRVNHASK